MIPESVIFSPNVDASISTPIVDYPVVTKPHLPTVLPVEMVSTDQHGNVHDGETNTTCDITSPMSPSHSLDHIVDSSPPVQSVEPMHTVPIRQSTRVTHKPSHLKESHCEIMRKKTRAQTSQNTTHHPISNFLNYDRLSNNQKSFSLILSTIHEPKSFHEAMKYPHWQKAIQDEIDALQANNTWTITDLPDHHTPIGCRFIFKTKLKADDSIEKYKARLVAQGFTQQFGLDYSETFSPVAKLTTVRIFLALAAQNKWHLTQLDVHNAFLNGDLEEDIYMKLPPGITIKGESHKNSGSSTMKVCKLQKSLYGLKQASRQWNTKLTKFLTNIGFIQSKHDYSLFTKRTTNSYITLLVYVDDILLGGTNIAEIEKVTLLLKQQFKIRDLGQPKYFLGVEISRSNQGIYLCQRKYALEIIEENGLLGCKPLTIPMEQNHKLSKEQGEPLKSSTNYRKIVGKLIYLTFTRPGISYAVNVLSQYMQAPTEEHLQAAYRVIKYLK